MTSQIVTHEVILVLSSSALPADESRQPLLDVMSRSGVGELHLMHINDPQTQNFHWPLLLEFRFPADAAPSAVESRVAKLRSDLTERCPWLHDESCVYLTLRQTAIGPESDGAVVIVSLYSWRADRSPAAREATMWEHFDMEQEEFLYTSVHFNVAHDSVNNEFDFAFQAYVDDLGSLERVYHNSRLEVMRRHSGGFLDTSTRRLAFGLVEILR